MHAAIRRAELTVVKTGAGSTESRVSRRCTELSSICSALPRLCGGAAAAAAPARPQRLPEGWFHVPRGQANMAIPWCPAGFPHGVSAPVSQGRDVKILLLGGGSCPLRSGGLFFSFRVISLNYRKSDQGPFLDVRLQEATSKRPFTASYLAGFILLNTAARDTQTIPSQESTITMSQKHLLFI